MHKLLCGLLLLLLTFGCAPSQQFFATPEQSLYAVTPPETTLAPTLTPSVSPTETRTPQASATAKPTLAITPAPTLEPSVHLMATGDLMLARTVAERIRTQGAKTVFERVAPVLAQADLVVANLECTISDRGAPQPKSYTFRAPLAAVEALTAARMSVVSQANNHALDFGADAFLQTLQLLKEHHIEVAGAGTNAIAAHTPAIVERNGLQIAFLAYVDVPVETYSGFDTRRWIATTSSPGVAWAQPEQIARDVSAARKNADVVIVILHSGYEYRTEPNALQRVAAHAAIDAGAALVIGAHPHILQGTEKYKSGLIAYSLGNFVADGFTGASNDSVIFSATLTRTGVTNFDFIPVVIEEGLPRPATEKEAPAILERVKPIQ